MAYLDNTGVAYLWTKIKALIPSTYVTSVNGSSGAVTISVPTTSDIENIVQDYVDSLDATNTSY